MISAILCVIGFVILIFLFFFRASSPRAPEQEKTIEVNHSPEAVVNYEKGTSGRLYEKLTGERNPSEQDTIARKAIISSLKNGSGTLLSSPNVLLGYLSSPDFFQAEILNSNVAVAKQEVVSWFISKGISKEGICDLPIMFYLGSKPAQEFIESREKFSPLAPGC